MTGDTNPNAVKPFNWAALKLYELGPRTVLAHCFFVNFLWQYWGNYYAPA